MRKAAFALGLLVCLSAFAVAEDQLVYAQQDLVGKWKVTFLGYIFENADASFGIQTLKLDTGKTERAVFTFRDDGMLEIVWEDSPGMILAVWQLPAPMTDLFTRPESQRIITIDKDEVRTVWSIVPLQRDSFIAIGNYIIPTNTDYRRLAMFERQPGGASVR